MIVLDDKTFYQVFIANVRYAIGRDNHLAPSSIINTFKRYYKDIARMEGTWKWAMINQVIEEITREIKMSNLAQAKEWEDFVAYLKQIDQ